MRINELFSESQNLDEGLGSMIGKGVGSLARGVGATVGGAAGAWDAAKQGYAVGKKAVSGRGDDDTTAPTSNTVPASNGSAAPANNTTGSADPATLRQQATNLNRQADQIERLQQTATTPTAPQDQALDLDQLRRDREAKAAAGVAGQQQAQQQMAATQQANAATNQQDAAIKAAADAAKAKPPFQQTAADKLAIKAAADKGIKEAKEKKKLKKKKIVAEFHSNFLGKMI
jgi:hypothetical protein